ncbi:unnamed protein product [Mesocestoides corti]|uniref:adenylyl-sulfate kinase n=1 Tax=Mesocestoides corti TaxID=53468 RepID=A0A3P6GX00_MESCO|nr:unnamed protein product [Mesocestoides corti]
MVEAVHTVSREDRACAAGDKDKFRGCTIWFTGLSGSGKSTLAFSLERQLVSLCMSAYSLDGDNVRLGLNKDLTFSAEDRAENIRRVAEMAKLFADSGTCIITSFISPYEKERKFARLLHEKANLPFIEVYLSTPLEVCEARDSKGLYAKARKGIIKDFTGISSSYEEPECPDLRLNTAELSVDECIDRLLEILIEKDIIPSWTGAKICELYVPAAERSAFREKAEALPKLEITEVDLQWVQVLAEGWASPLRGFMRENEYLQTLYFGGLVQGRGKIINLSIPIVLAVTTEDKARLTGSSLTLTHTGRPVALMENIEFYAHRKEERCNRIFGICDRGHPTIEQIMSSGDWLVGGDLHVLEPIAWNDGLDKFRLSPMQLRAKFKEIRVRGWHFTFNRSTHVRSLFVGLEMNRIAANKKENWDVTLLGSLLEIFFVCD